MDGFLVDPQGYNYARYSAFVPNARSLLTPDMGIDRSYLSPAEPWRDESRDEMLRMTLRVDGKPDYTLVLPADEEYLDAVKAYLDIDVFADAMLCDIRFKVPYIGELIRDTDCPAVEDYNDFAEALEDIWQQDGDAPDLRRRAGGREAGYAAPSLWSSCEIWTTTSASWRAPTATASSACRKRWG